MKSATAWATDPKSRFLRCHITELRAVQLDAMKEGMRISADLAEKKGYSRTPKQVRGAILHEEHLLELPPEPQTTKEP